MAGTGRNAGVPTIIHAVGDVAPRRADPRSIFAGVRDGLAQCDLLFGQLECPLSRLGSPAPNAKLAMRSDPAVAAALRAEGFGIVSVAGNHALDYGAEALIDTLAHVRAAGVLPCGAGRDMAEARAPALATAGGRTVACLAYSSILPTGYAAEGHRPGCAPMRAHTLFEQVEPDQPGTAPRVLTFAERTDLDVLLADVTAARAEADVVLLSFHWGVHFTRAVIADYQREVAHAAIAAGADAILGHHPHVLKGVEIHRGKPIVYSMGNFAIEQPHVFREDVHLDAAFRSISRLGGAWSPGRRYMTPEDTRLSTVARLEIGDDGGIALTLRPCRIDDASDPHWLAAETPEFDAWVRYMTEISAEAGLTTRYIVEGDRVRCA
jgi:poly-gamma-glutamate capsule biosynthesis protein CapA/YwtB (metallophosphatase superfamily)